MILRIKAGLVTLMLVALATTMAVTINTVAVTNTSLDDSDGLPQYVVHPRRIHSPNNQFSISIEPSQLNGRGSGEYTCSSSGKVLWAKTLPFTLWSAAITDQGTLIGYAYTQGVEGHRQDYGEVVVVVINAEGVMLVNEATPRVGTRFIHGLPTPMVNAIEINAENDRFLVRWEDPDINRRQERWDFYAISSGEKKYSIEPSFSTNNPDATPLLLQTHFIPGTKLTLAQFKTFSHRNYAMGFAIYGESEEPLWVLEKNAEFETASAELVDALHNRINTEGTILDNNNPKQFDLQFIKEAQRVTFEVESWNDRTAQVKEVRKQPQVYEVRPSATDPIYPGVSDFELNECKQLLHAGSIELKPTKETKPHPVRDISRGFDFDDAGHIGFIRSPKEGPATFVLVTQDGAVLAELELATDLLPESDWNGTTYVGQKQFVVTASQSGVGAQSQAWMVDTDAKVITKLENFKSPPVESVTSFRDGGFVVLANERFKFSMANSLSRFDAKGNRLWTIAESYEQYPKTLFGPQGVTATTDGMLCVLEGTKNELQYFDKNGKSVCVVELEKALGYEPNYLSAISAANDGGLMIYDFEGTSSYVEMTGNGTVRNGMDARIAQDRPVLNPSGPARVSPSGQLWLSDGTSLLRVGSDGLVDRTLGAEFDSELLGEIDFNMITSTGDILAISRRTGAIHRFDADGTSRKTISDPILLDRKYSSQPLFALPQGDVYVVVPEDTSSQRIVQFDSSGKRVRTINLSGYHAYCLSDDSFLTTDLTFALLQTNNGKLLKKIRRQPDGNWLQRISGVAIAPDGSFAISTFHYDSNLPLPTSVNIYSPKGDPIRTVPLPIGRLGQFDFDGRRLAVSLNDRTLIYSADGKLLSWASHRDFSGKSLFVHPKLLNDGNELVLIDRNNPLEIRRYR